MMSSSVMGTRATLVVAVAVSFPGNASVVPLATVAEFVIVVPAAPALTATVKINVEDVLAAMEVRVQLIEPEPPTEGVVQLQLAGVGMETNVVPVGIVSA